MPEGLGSENEDKMLLRVLPFVELKTLPKQMDAEVGKVWLCVCVCVLACFSSLFQFPQD